MPPEMFAKAVVRKGVTSTQSQSQISINIDRDILEWFESQGQDYPSQINALLREYMESHR